MVKLEHVKIAVCFANPPKNNVLKLEKSLFPIFAGKF